MPTKLIKINSKNINNPADVVAADILILQSERERVI